MTLGSILVLLLGLVAFVLGMLAFRHAHRSLDRSIATLKQARAEHLLIAIARRQITDALEVQTKMFARLVDERSEPKLLDRTRSVQ